MSGSCDAPLIAYIMHSLIVIALIIDDDQRARRLRNVPDGVPAALAEVAADVVVRLAPHRDQLRRVLVGPGAPVGEFPGRHFPGEAPDDCGGATENRGRRAGGNGEGGGPEGAGPLRAGSCKGLGFRAGLRR